MLTINRDSTYMYVEIHTYCNACKCSYIDMHGYIFQFKTKSMYTCFFPYAK